MPSLSRVCRSEEMEELWGESQVGVVLICGVVIGFGDGSNDFSVAE